MADSNWLLKTTERTYHFIIACFSLDLQIVFDLALKLLRTKVALELAL